MLNWEWENRDFYQNSAGPIFANLGGFSGFSVFFSSGTKTQKGHKWPRDVQCSRMCQNLFPNPLLNPALTQQHLQLQQKHFSKNPTELGMMQESIKPALGLFAAKIWSEKSNSKRGTCSWLSTQKCLGELWKFSSKVCSCSTSLSFMKSLHKPIPALHNFVIFQPPIPYFPLFRHPEHCNHHPNWRFLWK